MRDHTREVQPPAPGAALATAHAGAVRDGHGLRGRWGSHCAPGTRPGPAVLGRHSVQEQAAEQAAARAMRPGPVAGVPATGLGAGAAQDGRLPAPLRQAFAARFAHDFSAVRVHADAPGAQRAAAHGAQAVTQGHDIHFAAGQYRPDTATGQHLIAHELAHVRQAATGQVPPHTLMRRLGGDGDLDAGLPGGTATPPAATTRTPAKPAAASDASTQAAQAGTATPQPQPPVERPSVETIPAGGTPVDKVGVVARDTAPALRLRATPSTADDSNILDTLPFNTTLQVIKSFPGGWYFVATAEGALGYVASVYVKTDLPEPNAKLHRVEPGLPGTAIAIAERYFKEYANDWGQDLRFYVNVLAWVNHRPVPNTTAGWKALQFQAGEFIWIPTHDFARRLRSVVNSGSISHNIADAIGIADFLDRVEELWKDVRQAISLSKRYIGEAIARHVEAALWGVLESIALMLVVAAAVLAVSTAIGAAVAGLVSGGAAAPVGAAAGFEVGMVLLEWLGLAMLAVWIVQSLVAVGGAFGSFLVDVWDARGDTRKLDKAALQFAEAIGTLCGVLIEGLVMWAVSIGATQALGMLRGGRFGKAFNNSKTGAWLNERVRRVKAGETKIPTPKDVFARLVREVELVDARNSPIGEFDGVDVSGRRFVENKSASGIDKPNPRSGKPQQTASDWAAKQITNKTGKRIKALASAAATRGKGGAKVPGLAEIQGIRHIHFVIDGESPALRAAVFAELANLRAAFPGWTFSAEFGLTVALPPMPGTGQPDAPAQSDAPGQPVPTP